MANSIQVIHIEKRVSIASGLNRHITRQQFITEGETRIIATWVPDNADPNRTEGNVELVSRKFTNSRGQTYELTLQQAVDKRIQEAGIKLRRGQATCLEIIFSGSHDRMVAMSREELLDWANDTLKWSQKTWGEANVVSASLHVDETTPHIHMIVVPIVTGQSRRTRNRQESLKEQGKLTKTYDIDHNKQRLCVNEVYNQGRLYSYHNSYAKEVSSKYGMVRGVKAEPGSKVGHMSSIDYNRKLAAQAAEQESLIKEMTSDYEEKKTTFQKDIAELQETIDKQKNMIDINATIIEKLEELKSSTIIGEDAADRKILEKLQKVADLQVEETRLIRAINDKKTELATVDANVIMRRQQLAASVDLKEIPQKGTFGYKAESVDRFIESVNLATLRKAMNTVPNDVKVDQSIRDEIDRLRAIEDEYREFMNSRELMLQRLDYLENQTNRHKITEVLNYVLRKDIDLFHFTIASTTKDMFAKFTIKGDSEVYSAYISPKGMVYYTKEPIGSLQEALARCEEKIWYGGILDEIREKRMKEDTLSRFSTRLGLLIEKEILVTDYVTDGKQYLLFASDGRVYDVHPDGVTWSTADKRIKTLEDSRTYSNEKIWRNEGNINHLESMTKGHVMRR